MGKSIYLDSQHVSRLTDKGSDNIQLSASFDWYFSFSSIVEAMPKDFECHTEQMSSRRLKLIMSNPHHGLPPWWEVPRLESRFGPELTIESLRRPISQVFLPGGLDESLEQSKQEMLATLKEKITQQSSGMNRKSRRAHKSVVLRKDAMRTSALEAAARDRGAIIKETLLKSHAHLIPLFDKGGIYDFFFDRIDAPTFGAVFIRTFMNPISFPELRKFSEFECLDEISKSLWEMSQKMNILVKAVIDKIDTLGLLNNPYVDQNKIIESTSTTFDKIIHGHDFLSMICGDDYCGRPINEMPGTALFVRSIKLIIIREIRKKIQNPSYQSDLSRSTFGDLSNLFYEPYCDYFGCDRDMREVMKQTKYKPVASHFSSMAELKNIIYG